MKKMFLRTSTPSMIYPYRQPAGRQFKSDFQFQNTPYQVRGIFISRFYCCPVFPSPSHPSAQKSRADPALQKHRVYPMSTHPEALRGKASGVFLCPVSAQMSTPLSTRRDFSPDFLLVFQVLPLSPPQMIRGGNTPLGGYFSGD